MRNLPTPACSQERLGRGTLLKIVPLVRHRGSDCYFPAFREGRVRFCMCHPDAAFAFPSPSSGRLGWGSFAKRVPCQRPPPTSKDGDGGGSLRRELIEREIER